MHAIFDLNPDNAPSPDGLPTFFFKHSWDIVGNDIYRAAVKFFSTALLPALFQYNYICMVPKKESSKKISDFRLISLSNVSNKVLPKILTTRLTKTLPNIINKEQSVFLEGISITENIRLVQEFIQYTGRDA